MTVTQIKPADLSSSQQNKVNKSQQTTETMSSLEEQLRGARSSPIKKVGAKELLEMPREMGMQRPDY